MKRPFLYTTILAGVMTLSTLLMFHTGAQALDLSDFTGQDRKVITQDAPKAGGVVLVKEDVVYPTQPQHVKVLTARPVPTLTGYNGAYNSGASFNAMAPAAGGTLVRADGSTGVPGKGIDNKLDITTMPGNSYDQVRARFNAGGASGPVDGKPLVTTTLANGARVQDLNEITPAAGGAMIQSNVSSGQSIQAMTGRNRSHMFNN